MKRKPHTPDEKAKLVLEILRGERPLNETASENGVHPKNINGTPCQGHFQNCLIRNIRLSDLFFWLFYYTF